MLIRPFRVQDKARIHEIFCATAYHGRSIDFYFDSGPWLAELVVDSYLEIEPESTWVAEQSGHVVGYLTGTLDTARLHRLWAQKMLSPLATHFFTQGVWAHSRNWRFFKNSMLSALRKEGRYPTEFMSQFPAHLHINVDPSQRGEGAGSLLMEKFFDYLKAQNVLNVHARTSRPDGRHPFFEKSGFRILSKEPLRIWDYLHEKNYELITYVKTLAK